MPAACVSAKLQIARGIMADSVFSRSQGRKRLCRVSRDPMRAKAASGSKCGLLRSGPELIEEQEGTLYNVHKKGRHTAPF
jgi:hypothetical protein